MIFINLIINWMLLNALSVSDFIGKLKNIYFKIKYLLKDIFYQNYNPKNGTGDLVCKICDPKSFK